VNWIVAIIRQRRGVVGLYPEGQSSWNGTSSSAYPSTAKLLRLLRVPVVMAKTNGGYLTKPRWSHVRRPGMLEVSFSLLFTPEQLKALSISAIDAALNEALSFNDYAWRQREHIVFKSSRGAESLELAFYICPSCGTRASLHSKENRFTCDQCGFQSNIKRMLHSVCSQKAGSLLLSPLLMQYRF